MYLTVVILLHEMDLRIGDGSSFLFVNNRTEDRIVIFESDWESKICGLNLFHNFWFFKQWSRNKHDFSLLTLPSTEEELSLLFFQNIHKNYIKSQSSELSVLILKHNVTHFDIRYYHHVGNIPASNSCYFHIKQCF